MILFPFFSLPLSFYYHSSPLPNSRLQYRSNNDNEMKSYTLLQSAQTVRGTHIHTLLPSQVPIPVELCGTEIDGSRSRSCLSTAQRKSRVVLRSFDRESRYECCRTTLVIIVVIRSSSATRNFVSVFDGGKVEEALLSDQSI